MKNLEIGTMLLDALYRRGVREIFGIPGDFALNFFKAIEDYKKIRLITFSHEPGLGFAADGLSRIKRRMAVVAITYGAGGLNIVNAVACAFAEKSPLVIISGAPGTDERGKKILFHHQAKEVDSQLKVFREITAYQTVLNEGENAPFEVEKALTLCTELASPVYIEIPRNQVFKKCSAPTNRSFHLPEDKAATAEAAQEIADKLSTARRPLIMVGVEIQRFSLANQVVKLAEKLRIPVATSFMGRASFPVNHPLFAGTYLGSAGSMTIMKQVENSDALLLLGVILADTNMALRLSALHPKNILHCISRRITVGSHTYDNVPLRALLPPLIRKAKRHPVRRRIQASPFPALKPAKFFDDSPLTVETIVQALNRLMHEQGPMPVVADNGDCLFASLDIPTPTLIASGYYATMGFAVPAGMGLQLGGGGRPLILVGDGAFQMTGPEISHCPRLQLNPLTVVFNNQRWEMLRTIQPQGHYFDLTNWDFAALAELWGGFGVSAKTKLEMWEALQRCHRQKKFAILDAILPLGETSRVLKNYLRRIRH